MDNLLRYKEVADFLGFAERTIKLWVHTNYIPYIPLGIGRKHSIRFDKNEVEAWINTRKIRGRKEFNNPLS